VQHFLDARILDHFGEGGIGFRGQQIRVAVVARHDPELSLRAQPGAHPLEAQLVEDLLAPVAIDPAGGILARRQAKMRADQARLGEAIDVVDPGAESECHHRADARRGHQQATDGRIGLDLLAQPIDMRLQRMRRHTRVVTPDLVQQLLAQHRAVGVPVEELKDIDFLRGQAQSLLFVRSNQ